MEKLTLEVVRCQGFTPLFLAFGASGEGWEVRRSGAGEVLSLLHGPCSSVHGVALDPAPEIFGDPLLKLMTVAKEDFEDSILAAMSPSRRRRMKAVAPIRGSLPA
ncbi:MAG: hypothetical protein H0U65_13670 [Rubrobacter sp.]|nr:hypothetical protein [Rubrobacter sp.]